MARLAGGRSEAAKIRPEQGDNALLLSLLQERNGHENVAIKDMRLKTRSPELGDFLDAIVVLAPVMNVRP